VRADFTKKKTHNLMQMQQQLRFPPRLVLSKDTLILLNFQSTQERKKERKKLEEARKNLPNCRHCIRRRRRRSWNADVFFKDSQL
jgi:hypothetical protein